MRILSKGSLRRAFFISASDCPPQLQLGPSISMQTELAAPFVMTAELKAEIRKADDERREWACKLAFFELVQDASKFATDDCWHKAFGAKAKEIFARLN
jgi:hypothetical protein